MSKLVLKTWTHRAQPFVIVILAASFYVYEFFVRVMPSAMTTELMMAFDIDASGLGMLSALFFYGYAPMQIPAGLLLDRFGPRTLISVAAFFCGLGTLIFGLTDSLLLASVGRIMVGVTSSFAFIGTLVITSRWFAAKYFAFITGLVQFMGSMGAIAGAAPVAVLVHHYGWHSTTVWTGVVGISLSVLLWMVIRSHPDREMNQAKNRSSQVGGEWERLKTILGSRQTWVNGVLAFCAWAPATIFQALWGVPFLVQLYDTSSAVATSLIALAWIGTAVGCPFLGWWSNRINSRRIPFYTSAVLALMSSVLVLYLPSPPMALMMFLLFCMGLGASSMTIAFGVVQDIHPPSMAGTAVGYTNMMVIGAGVLLQPLVGIILDHQWSGDLFQGAPIYSIENYRIALSCIPLCNLLGLIVCRFLKETHCVAQYDLPFPEGKKA